MVISAQHRVHRTSAGVPPHFRDRGPKRRFSVWWLCPPNPALAGTLPRTRGRPPVVGQPLAHLDSPNLRGFSYRINDYFICLFYKMLWSTLMKNKLQTAQEIIANIKDNPAEEIVLKGLGLKEIPNQLIDLNFIVTIDLSENNIEDISCLAKLPNLKSIILSNNTIKDLGSLSSFHNLEYINLNKNFLKDINCLSQLPNLIYLSLNDNQITDITSLCFLNRLTILNLSHNAIEDIEVLSMLENIEALDLSRNKITTVKPLLYLKTLEEVFLHENQLYNLEEIRHLLFLPNIYTVSLYHNHFPAKFEALCKNPEDLTALRKHLHE
jgi:Leucine-rich repeat (LRR) protein